jgi:hypothetical protein
MNDPVPSSEPRKRIPPYLPFKTFINALESWRVVLPNRIDRGVLGSYAGTMQTWVMATLRFFELIDEQGVPTDLLRRLVNADDDDRSKVLNALARHHYDFLFVTGFDLARATPGELREKFEATGASGETAGKAISFFSALARTAHIPMSPFVKSRQRRSGNGRRPRLERQVTASGAVITNTPALAPPQTSKTAFEVLYELLDLQMEPAEQEAIWTLLRYLKKRGS